MTSFHLPTYPSSLSPSTLSKWTQNMVGRAFDLMELTKVNIIH